MAGESLAQPLTRPPGDRASLDAWVARVLGVRAGASSQAASATTATAPGRPVLAVWRDAIEGVGEGIGRLQDKMRGLNHPTLSRVADQGLGAFTKKLQVGLHVALMNFDQADAAGRPKARERALSMVAEFRGFLAGDPVVRLLDNNPFGIAVNMQGSLGAALDTVEAALQR